MIPVDPMRINAGATDRHRLELAFALGPRVPALPGPLEPHRPARTGRRGPRR